MILWLRMNEMSRYSQEEGLSPEDMIEDEPVIFLDIDGPLNTQRHMRNLTALHGPSGRRDLYGPIFDPEAVDNLRDVVENTDAQIVISSTWRILMSIEEMQEMWTERDLPGEIIDYTPRCGDAPRGWEIRKWLLANRVSQFENYVIFDDDGDMLWWQRKNFLLVSFDVGIESKHAKKAIHLLNQ